MFFNHQSQNFKVPRMHSPILAASESSAKEEDVKWLEFMDNHHEQCDISKCMGKRINGLFACQFTSIPGSMYSQYLRHRRRMGSYKTKPCRYVFEQWRSCLAGEDCPFYHSLEEKRDIPQPALQPAIFDFVPQHNAEPCLLDELILQVHETTERMYKQALNTEEFLRVLDNDQEEDQRPKVPNKHRDEQLWEFNANLKLAAPFVPAMSGNHKNNNTGREYQCGVNGLMRFDSGLPSSDVMGNWGDCSTSSHSNSPPRPIGVGGAAAGIPPPQPAVAAPLRPLPNAIGGAPMPPEPPPGNEASTVRPSALLGLINKADEGFNQVITHFEQGTPIEAAAIDIMEVALGSQELDSQAKLLSHVDRAFGLDNLQRLQRWANTGGALDIIKEQFAKIAKNYKPPPAANAFTLPPQLDYLFQPGGSGG